MSAPLTATVRSADFAVSNALYLMPFNQMTLNLIPINQVPLKLTLLEGETTSVIKGVADTEPVEKCGYLRKPVSIVKKTGFRSLSGSFNLSSSAAGP